MSFVIIFVRKTRSFETDARGIGNGDLLTDFGYITVLAIDRHGIDSRSHAAADAHPKFQAVAQM